MNLARLWAFLLYVIAVIAFFGGFVLYGSSTMYSYSWWSFIVSGVCFLLLLCCFRICTRHQKIRFRWHVIDAMTFTPLSTLPRGVSPLPQSTGDHDPVWMCEHDDCPGDVISASLVARMFSILSTALLIVGAAFLMNGEDWALWAAFLASGAGLFLARVLAFGMCIYCDTLQWKKDLKGIGICFDRGACERRELAAISQNVQNR